MLDLQWLHPGVRYSSSSGLIVGKSQPPDDDSSSAAAVAGNASQDGDLGCFSLAMKIHVTEAKAAVGAKETEQVVTPICTHAYTYVCTHRAAEELYTISASSLIGISCRVNVCVNPTRVVLLSELASPIYVDGTNQAGNGHRVNSKQAANLRWHEGLHCAKLCCRAWCVYAPMRRPAARRSAAQPGVAPVGFVRGGYKHCAHWDH